MKISDISILSDIKIPFKPLDFTSDDLPRIKKFERETERKKSEKIFGPFKIVPKGEKSSFIKSQEKSFMNPSKRDNTKD